MKAHLYYLIRPVGGSWHVSLNLQADRHYWMRRAGGPFRMRVLEPALSFGQAYAFCERLSALSGKVRWQEQIRQLASMAEEWDISKERMSTWQWRDWTPPNLLEEPAANAIGHSWIERIPRIYEAIRGRFLLVEEFSSLLKDRGLADGEADLTYGLQYGWLCSAWTLEPGIRWLERPISRLPFVRSSRQLQCKRCGTSAEAGSRTGPQTDGLVRTLCHHCGTLCAYCEQCLTMGRVRACTPLIRIGTGQPETGRPGAAMGSALAAPGGMDAFLKPWGLSEVQTEAAREALAFLQHPPGSKRVGRRIRRFLFWAVTGAGKTEMIFPLIAFTLFKGGRVVVTTPRRDVVLELRPRIQKAFPEASVVTLYGGSEQRWEQGDITIATTHQLMRFREAFDLVVIDEIDAFPYHNNPLLEFAAEQVCAPGGAYILLSATPPVPLQREVRRGTLPHARVAARYHRHPLPVPQLLQIPGIARMTSGGGGGAGKLVQLLDRSLKRGAQVFVFVPKIYQVEPVAEWLRKQFPEVRTEGTSSKDADRASKVVAFRERDIRLLVTTTILERGVTIPQSDVFILEADSTVFDAAALVQMAGRAGRSAQDPNGFVVFAAKERTSSQKEAVRQIVEMNKIARKKGYLK